MNDYIVNEGHIKSDRSFWGMTISPKRIEVDALFPSIDVMPDEFDWSVDRLCGINYMDGSSLWIGFRPNPLSASIDIIGCHTSSAGVVTVTDYCPVNTMTVANIIMQVIPEESVVMMRVNATRGGYVRKIDNTHCEGLGMKVGVKLSKPSPRGTVVYFKMKTD